MNSNSELTNYPYDLQIHNTIYSKIVIFSREIQNPRFKNKINSATKLIISKAIQHFINTNSYTLKQYPFKRSILAYTKLIKVPPGERHRILIYFNVSEKELMQKIATANKMSLAELIRTLLFYYFAIKNPEIAETQFKEKYLALFSEEELEQNCESRIFLSKI